MNISPLVQASGPQDAGERLDAIRQLDATRIGDGNLLMAVPLHGEAIAWARACIQNDIGAVVSLGTQEEHDKLYPCMEYETPFVADGWEVEFMELEGAAGAGPAAKRLKEAHLDAFAGIVQINMGPRGDQPHTRHEVSNFTIPISPDQAVSPTVLLATCHALHEEVSGRPIAFQSPHGDSRAAVFAAAHGLFQGFVKGEVHARNLEACVERQCDDLSAARSVARCDGAEHKASLLAMGRMMLDDPRDGHRGTPTAMRTPELLSAPLAAAPRSAMKVARAQERELQAQQETRAKGKTVKKPAVHFEKKWFGLSRLADRKEAREAEAQKMGWTEEERVQVRQSPGRRSASTDQTFGQAFPSEKPSGRTRGE